MASARTALVISSAVIVLKMGTMQQQQHNSFYSLFLVLAITVWWVGHIDYTHSRPNSYFTVEHPRERHCHLSLDINLPQFTLLLCLKARCFTLREWELFKLKLKEQWQDIICQSEVFHNFITPPDAHSALKLVALRCSYDMWLALCFDTVSQSLMQWHKLYPFLSHTVRSTAVCSGSMQSHPLET